MYLEILTAAVHAQSNAETVQLGVDIVLEEYLHHANALYASAHALLHILWIFSTSYLLIFQSRKQMRGKQRVS